MKEMIAACEGDLRQGRNAHIIRRLARLNSAAVPREFRLPLANVCWRAGLTSLGLKMLAPLMRTGRRGPATPPSPEEISEYAALLLRAGGHVEAIARLSPLDPERTPRVLLYQAFCNFARWEHDQAVPLLERYLKLPIEPYAKLVGQVNLIAALTAAGRFDEALPFSEEVVEIARAGQHTRLLGNCLEIQAQIHLQRREFTRAREALNAATGLFANNQAYDAFFVKKWSALLDGLEHGQRAAVESFRAEALRLGEWESVREADRFLLMIEPDEAVFHRLLFGTSSEGYRQRILQGFPQFEIPAHHVWGFAGGVQLTVETGEIEGARLKAGRKIHRVLEILARDRYRPQRLAGLFNELFPDEHFDIFSSPGRVHSWLWLTRGWLEAHGLAAEIRAVRGTYRLEFLEPGVDQVAFAMKVRLERHVVTPEESRWDSLLRLYGDGEFSAREACAKAGIPRTSMQRLLNWALERGVVTREQRGSAVLYRARSARQAA